MAKEAFYFSHDYGARNDPKLQKVLMKLGQEGKGVYWDLVEMLFEEGGKLLLSECDSYAFALRTNETCIAKLLNDFGLFCQDATHFWSESVNRRILEREGKSEKARQSALNRWNNANASKINANALRQECEGNAKKERKEKESTNQEVDTSVGLATPTPTNVIPFTERCEGFIKKFNELRGTKFQCTDKVSKSLKSRLKKYTSSQIISALKVAINDSMHIDENFKYLTPEYILREEILERYLNIQPNLKQQNSASVTVYVPPAPGINHQHLETIKHDS